MTSVFSSLAKEQFAFLMDRGFSLTADDSEKVCYQSAQSLVCITWDKRSGELDVYFQPQPHAEVDSPFSLRDLLAMEGVNVPEAKNPFQVSEQDRLHPFLTRLACDVDEHATKALAGDRMYFRQLSEYRGNQARAFMKDMQLRQTRAKADKAWQLHDYGQVVEQYESIRDDLSAAELKKLVIATNRMHSSD
jgi:hypothetical protein